MLISEFYQHTKWYRFLITYFCPLLNSRNVLIKNMYLSKRHHLCIYPLNLVGLPDETYTGLHCKTLIGMISENKSRQMFPVCNQNTHTHIPVYVCAYEKPECKVVWNLAVSYTPILYSSQSNILYSNSQNIPFVITFSFNMLLRLWIENTIEK